MIYLVIGIAVFYLLVYSFFVVASRGVYHVWGQTEYGKDCDLMVSASSVKSAIKVAEKAGVIVQGVREEI